MAELNNQSLAAIYAQQLRDSQQAYNQYQAGAEDRALQQQAAEAERQRQQQEAAAAAAAEAERTRDRTVLEHAGDFGLASLQTAVGLGGAGYGLANVATVGLLDRATGFSQNLQETQQTLESLKSTPLQARKEEAGRVFRDEGLAAGGLEYLKNPSLLFDLGVQSAAYLLPGAAAARFFGGAARANAAARGLSTVAQQQVAHQAATRASLVSQGALTGGYLNPEAINAAREAGVSEGGQQLVGLGAAAVGAITNPLISKFTGAAGLEARAANALFGGASMPAQTGSAAARVGAFTTTQAVEEAAQEATEKAIVNVAGQRPIGEGVGESAVLGGILGGVLGGAMGLTQIRQPSATRQELADLQAQVETELAGETGVPAVRPSLIRQVGLQDALNRLELSQQLPQVDEVEEIDLGAAPLPVSVEEIDVGAVPVPVPVEEIDMGAAVPPGLSGLNRVVAEQRAALAQQPPRPTVSELPVEQIDITQLPTAPAPVSRPLADIIRETAPIERVAEQFGPAVAGAEQARRMAAQAPTSVEAPAAPLDLSTPKAVGEYRRSVREALGGTIDRPAKDVKGPYISTLTQRLADAGVRPGTPEFDERVGVEVSRLLGEGADGKSDLLGALNNAYPVTQEQQLDAAFDRGGVPTTEEELFGPAPAERAAPAAAPGTPRTGRDEKYGIDVELARDGDGFVITTSDENTKPTRISAGLGGVFVNGNLLNMEGEFVPPGQIVQGATGPIPTENQPYKPQSKDQRAQVLALVAEIEFARGIGDMGLVESLERRLFDFVTGRTESAAPAANKPAAPKPQRDLTIKEQIADLGGILTSYRQDITGDTKASTAEAAPGRGRIFSETGTSPDDMAMQLAERNFVPAEELARDGGVQWLYDAVNRSLAGDKIYAQGSAAQERQFDEQMAEQAAQPEQSADAANPKQVTAAPPRYDARKWADYMTYPGAAQLNALTNRKESEADPQPVLSAMLMGLDEAETIDEYAQLATAAQAHPEFFMMSQDARSQVSTHMATAWNRLTGATFELGLPNMKRPVDQTELQRALAMSEDDYIATINPTGEMDTEEEGIILNLGDLDTPADAVAVTSFTDSQGGTVSVLRGADGSMYAVQNGQTLGSIGPFEDGSTGIQLVREAQGKGVGRRLTMEYLRENPFAPAGSFTAAGEANRRSAFRALKAEQAKLSQGAVDAGMNKRLFDKGVETAARNYGRPIFGFDTVAQLEEQLGFPLPEGMKGVYFNGEIYVVRENIANGKELTFTVAHEVGHRGLEALLGSSLKAATNRMWANADMRKRIRAKMAELNMAQGTEEERRASRTLAAEEVLADMLAGNERLNKDIWSKLRAGVREFLARVFGIRNYVVTNKEVDDLLTDVARVIKGAPAAQVREKMQNPGLWINDANQAAEADPKFSKASADMDEMLAAGAREGASNVQPFSVAGKALANASINAAKSVWTAVKENKIGGLFTHNLMSLDQMVEWHDKLFRLPGAKTGLLSKVYDLKSNREAEFNRHIGAQRAHQYNTVKDGEPVTTDLGKFSVHDMIGEWDDYKRKNPAKAALLDHVNSEGTFYKVFPDRKWEDQVVEGFDYTDAGYTEEDRKQAWLRVSRAYNALDAQGKTIYQRAQSVYSQLSADRFSAIKAETDRLGKRAEAAAVAAGVDPAKVSARVAAAQDRYKKQIDAIIGRIKQGPYSPLMRFGDYVVTVRDETGNVVHFSAYESVAERDAAAAEIGEQPDGYVVSTSMTRDQALEDAGVQRSEVEAIRSEVMALLPDDMDPEIRDSAMAAITAGLAEAYLQSLPAKSFAKHGLGRKNVAGYDTNSLRAFSNYTIRGARSIAGIKYDGQIGNAMLEIDQYVRDVARGKYADGEGVKRVDATKLQGVANAVKRQHMAALRMDNNKLSSALTTAAFTYQLTSPSQLLFNATQTPMVAFPRLAGIYGGGRAAKALSKALRDYTASGLDLLRTDTDAAGRAKSVLRNPTNPADAKVLEALQQIKDDGPLDITQAHDASGIADGSAGELHPYGGQVMLGLSYFMHKSEVFNRQITTLAAVRLELEKQMSSGADLNDPALVAELVRIGKRAIDTTQFNFAKFAKPPAMQGPIGKVVLQYRLFQLNMLSTLARDIRDGLFGSDPETKRIARETLAWTLGMQLAFMGTAGTILAPLVFAIADMFREDDDLTTSRQAYVAAVGKFAAHGALAGFLDMGRAEAASLFPILSQGAYAPVDGKPGDTFSYYITQNLGPSFGLAKNLYTGMANVADGDFEKGFQNLMPKPLADAHKAVYDGINGVRNAQDVVYHELSPWGAATQFLGFRSGERRELEGQRSAFYTANANKFKVRDRYLAKLALGTGTGDRSLIDEAMEGIQAWNARYPDPQFMIKRQDIARAITRRQNQQRVAAETGLVSSRPISPVFDAVLGR